MTRTILVVDDDADVRSTLRYLLTDAGFVVYTANDGHHALHLLDRIDPPALILLDYKMPVMDGKHFLAVIRETARYQAVPVVLLSAWTREWSGARLEVHDVLVKPVDPELLLRLVRAICGDGAGRTSQPNTTSRE